MGRVTTTGYTVIGGNDTVNGGAGNDWVYGDFLRANSTNLGATIIGGDDIIIGGTGNDHLFGDIQDINEFTGGIVIAGSDTFVFATGSGVDTIHDFNDGMDLIDVGGYGFLGIGDMTVTEIGADTVIDFDGTNGVTVVGVIGLAGDDFVFA